MNLLRTSLIFLLATAVAFGGGTSTDWVKLRSGSLQRIEFKGVSGKTDLVAATPTGNNVATLQDGTGVVAFLSDIGGSAFPPTGTLYVDAGNTADGSEDGSAEHPFDLIAEAITASSTLNVINIAPGTYPEVLVIPHKLYFHAQAALGITSIDISTAGISGHVGKIEFSFTTGCIIHSDDSATDNADCLDFAVATGLTQSGNRFAIGLTSAGTYDWEAHSSVLFNLISGNGPLIDVYGIGATPPLLTKTSGAFFQLGTGSNSFQNLELVLTGGGASSTVINAVLIGDGDISDIITNHNIVLATTGGKWNGTSRHVICAQMKLSGDAYSVGSVTELHILESFGESLTVGNFNGILQMISGELKIDGELLSTAHIDLTSNSSLVISVSAIDDVKCIIKCGQSEEGISPIGNLRSILSGRWTGVRHSSLTTSSLKAFRFAPDVEISNSKFTLPFQALNILGVFATIPPGVRFEHSTFFFPSAGGTIGKQIAGSVNAGHYTFCNFDAEDATTNIFPVSDGMVLDHCVFSGWRQVTLPVDAVLRGWDLLLNSIDATVGTFYDATNDRIVFSLLGQPSEFDGTDDISLIASGSTFTGTIYMVGQAGTGDDITAVEGALVNFEVFDDGGTWKLRSLASSSTLLDDLLGNPGSDLTAQFGNSAVGFEAAVTFNNVILNGALIGQEVTVSYGDIRHETMTLDDDSSVFGVTLKTASLTKNRTIFLDDEGFPLISPNFLVIPIGDWHNDDTVADKGNALDVGANVGIHTGDAANEMWLTVGLPQGKKATLVDITSNQNRAIEAFSVTSAGVKTSLGTGNANTQLDITDMNSTQTTYLLLNYASSSMSDDIRFTLITLEDI